MDDEDYDLWKVYGGKPSFNIGHLLLAIVIGLALAGATVAILR